MLCRVDSSVSSIWSFTLSSMEAFISFAFINHCIPSCIAYCLPSSLPAAKPSLCFCSANNNISFSFLCASAIIFLAVCCAFFIIFSPKDRCFKSFGFNINFCFVYSCSTSGTSMFFGEGNDIEFFR